MDRLLALARRVRRRGRVECRPMEMRRFDRDLQEIREIYNQAWAENWGFSPILPEEFRFQAASFKPLVDPRLCRIAEAGGRCAGFILMIPDANVGIRACRGRLLPFGFLKLMRALRRAKRARVILLGVKKEFRNQGLEVLLITEIFQAALAMGFESADLSWVLEDNVAMIQPLARVGARPWRRFRIYEKPA